MNIKKGFTLSEVLITLAIVGVIAVLTLPGRVNNTSKKITGATVGRSVELIENGFKNVLNAAHKNNVVASTLANLTIEDVFGKDVSLGSDITSSDYLVANFNLFNLTKSFMGTEDVDISYFANAKLYNGDNAGYEIKYFKGYRFIKTNAYIIVQNIGDIINVQANNPNTILTRVIIDTNGPKPPNIMGKDIFLFGLSNSGILVPAGTNNYNTNNIYSENTEDFESNCTNANITDGKACAGRLANDNWQINYR